MRTDASPVDGLRLAVVVSHPTQYYAPWFRWITEHSAVQLRVFYLWDFGVRATVDPQFGASFTWDIDLLGGYESEFVPNQAKCPGTYSFRGLQNPDLPRRIAAWRPDAILLFGYAYQTHLQLIAWARVRGVPLIFRGDSHFLGRDQPGRLIRAALTTLYRQFAAITYVGAANRAYFKHLKVPDSRLFFAPHAVDAARFRWNDSATTSAGARLRAEAGIAPNARVVLFAGKFVAAKQPLALLDAFLELNEPGAALVFVGSGEEEALLRARADSSGHRQVRFLPFANQSEMPARYAMADIFALPSRGHYETWGLAVNEAMHVGVPALVSDRVGCQQDLVTPGTTGWVFHADSRESLRHELRRALFDNLAPLRANVRSRIANYTYTSATAGLIDALQFVRCHYGSHALRLPV